MQPQGYIYSLSHGAVTAVTPVPVFHSSLALTTASGSLSVPVYVFTSTFLERTQAQTRTQAPVGDGLGRASELEGASAVYAARSVLVPRRASVTLAGQDHMI